MLIGLVTEEGEEEEEGGKSHSKVGTRWVRQKTFNTGDHYCYDGAHHFDLGSLLVFFSINYFFFLSLNIVIFIGISC